MKKLQALLLTILMVCPVWATTPKKMVPLVISGDTVVVVKSLPCKVTAPAGATLYSWNLPTGVVGTADDNVMTITAAPSGDSTISVNTITITGKADKDGNVVLTKVNDSGSIVLTNGLAPPPIPVPADPLTASFQAAYTLDADSDKAKSLTILQGFYKGFASQVLTRTDLKTNSDYATAMKTGLATVLTTTQVKNLRTVIASEFVSAWGTTSTAITPAVASAEITKVANALGGVK